MESIVILPDENLQYISHEMYEGTILIYVESTTQQSICPYCEKASNSVHSRYMRELSDLPIQGNKVKLLLNNKKYFCINENCTQKTFAQRFSFFEPKSTKTKRLWDEIIKISLTQSSLSASKYLRGSVTNVGKSTICNLLKKRCESNR